MDKSIKYNLVEDVTIKHHSNLADIPVTKVLQSNSDEQERGLAKTLDQMLAEGSLAGPEIPTSTSVIIFCCSQSCKKRKN